LSLSSTGNQKNFAKIEKTSFFLSFSSGNALEA